MSTAGPTVATSAGTTGAAAAQARLSIGGVLVVALAGVWVML